MIHPLNSAPEPKRRFVPSKWEHEKVMKIVRAIRHVICKLTLVFFLMIQGQVSLDKPEKKSEADAVYDIWANSLEESGAIAARRAIHIPAPKLSLPGHDESYNPPAEYLLTPEEERRWRDTDAEDRKRDFIPQKYNSLRLVPGYSKFVHERFNRCLDLYLCPRTRRVKVCSSRCPLLICR